MATQALYRRYRPRRFSELKGQDHVVKALRNAVMHHREGQAYLFSGPRGTGKTTSARILAKVLNCEAAVEGEPCCACPSCLAVEAGTSYDVHELDAASNNGVDAMRDLIDKAMLGTPGRHKVYILDEVHMLSKAAEAALLKTLEEPPPHVVFVLATTDPQKVSDTIRSRTQHLQFHLLPVDVLSDHIRWLAHDAGLDISDQAFDAVLRRGGGSARDTISALELVAASGGEAPEEVPLDEFVEAIIDHDPGRALAAVAASVRLGREPRMLAEALVSHVRDCFLSLMAPDLVQLSEQRIDEIAMLARRLGAPAAVRSLEVLGTILVEMRHAPDPRILLDVALVKLTNVEVDSGTAALAARLERLEAMAAHGSAFVGSAAPTPGGGPAAAAPPRPSGPTGPSASATAPTARPAPAVPAAPAAPTAPRDERGRAVLGGRIRRDDTAGVARPASPAAGSDAGSGSSAPSVGADDRSTAPEVPAAARREVPAAASDRPADVVPIRRPTERSEPPRPEPSSAAPTRSADPAPAAAPSTASSAGARPQRSEELAGAHLALMAVLRPLAKAALANGAFTAIHDGVVTLALPSEPLRRRADDAKAEFERALSDHFGARIGVQVVVDGAVRPIDHDLGAPHSAAPPPPEDDEVDLSELVDAPAEEQVSGLDRIAAAFPGSELIDEPD